MKLFSCQTCQQILFFESVECTRCGRALAYLPDRAQVSVVTRSADGGPVRLTAPDGTAYRACRNGWEHGVCNWAVPASDPIDYCRACRLNQVIPNLGSPGAKEAWHRLEAAKRRLFYTLFALGLPVESKDESPAAGLAFEFLADTPGAMPPVRTGHEHGIITINIAEADDPFREKIRVQMGEAYRTLLGHFRHEIGHYYFDRLIANTPLLQPFRDRFGDERADYQQSLDRHYAHGAPADWSTRFVSAYASMHPSEDWAETWAHYLHMIDTLETARAYGLSLRPDFVAPPLVAQRLDPRSFQDLLAGWFPLTLAMNSLNRSLGLPDPYPFVFSGAAVEKLRFVHEVVASAGHLPALHTPSLPPPEAASQR